MRYSLYVDNYIDTGAGPIYQTDSLEKAKSEAESQALTLNDVIVVWDDEAIDFIYTANY